MNADTINELLNGLFGMIFIFGFFGLIILGVKMDNDFELKKLGILRPKSKNIKVETNYNGKIKYQIKFWIINIIALIIICIIAKIFGFGIKDIVDLIK